MHLAGDPYLPRSVAAGTPLFEHRSNYLVVVAGLLGLISCILVAKMSCQKRERLKLSEYVINEQDNFSL